jgi:hypothetical protein
MGPATRLPDARAAQDDSPLRPGEWQPGARAEAQQSTARAADESVDSLAATRGQDWALPGAARGSVAITRPIRVHCHPDRLVIVPEAGLGGGKTVPLGQHTEEAIDEFVSAVWEYMELWGIAGRGMYWRPVLHVDVGPGAERRFEQISILLEGSGLAVDPRQEEPGDEPPVPNP